MSRRVLCPICTQRMMSRNSRYTACRRCVRALDRSIQPPWRMRLIPLGIIMLFIVIIALAILIGGAIQK